MAEWRPLELPDTDTPEPIGMGQWEIPDPDALRGFDYPTGPSRVRPARVAAAPKDPAAP